MLSHLLFSKATQESELFCLDRDTFERIVELELKQQENYVPCNALESLGLQLVWHDAAICGHAVSNARHAAQASDPRKAIADFYSPGDHRGPGGVASGAGSSQWFAVYRPTSRNLEKKVKVLRIHICIGLKIAHCVDSPVRASRAVFDILSTAPAVHEAKETPWPRC